jgi:hypothetical protein
VSDDSPLTPFTYEGLDPVPERKSTIAEVSDAVKGKIELKDLLRMGLEEALSFVNLPFDHDGLDQRFQTRAKRAGKFVR